MLSITPLINTAATYSVGKDLHAVSLIARSPLFLVARPKTGVKNLREFVIGSNEGKRSPQAPDVASSPPVNALAISCLKHLNAFHIGSSPRDSNLQSNQLHSCFQLTWAAVQVSGSGADAAMTSKRFQNVNCSAFVGKIR
jgi:hypothetical protein